ncbi:MAG: dipeptide/oligopeptide/nickel ABC transporter ATP-binding protein [Candidatus Thiodiazotropha taylori]
MELHSVSVVYPSHGIHTAALSGVSLTLAVGETVAIVGRSGAGKTTLALVAAGLLRPVAGEVRHFGRVLKNVSSGAPSPIQMVFQNPYAALNPRRTIRSWLRLILARRRLGKSEGVEQFLALAGLPESRLDALPGQLSGGECQRACIAASLAAKGRGLILDEPVTMLDSIARQTVVRTLQQLRESRNLSYLLITHDLALATELCDQAYVIDEGRIIEGGALTDVFTKPTKEMTRKLVNASFGRYQSRQIF